MDQGNDVWANLIAYAQHRGGSGRTGLASDAEHRRGQDWRDLAADGERRRAFGIAKYGVPLGWDDGREPVPDTYQEAMDLVAYLWRVSLAESCTKRKDLRAKVEREVCRIVTVTLPLLRELAPGQDLLAVQPPPRGGRETALVEEVDRLRQEIEHWKARALASDVSAGSLGAQALLFQQEAEQLREEVADLKGELARARRAAEDVGPSGHAKLYTVQRDGEER